MEVSSTLAAEKEIDVGTTGTLFAATQSHFTPFAQPCALELVALLPDCCGGRLLIGDLQHLLLNN